MVHVLVVVGKNTRSVVYKDICLAFDARGDRQLGLNKSG